MTYVITEPCIGHKDGACVQACPVDCIYADDENDRMLFIHPDQCIACSLCEIACARGAIFNEENVPLQWQPFIGINRLYFENRTEAQAQINRLYPLERNSNVVH
jgi:NAD-dependent dihydropyrimidine dehydrogenase PreA subunit